MLRKMPFLFFCKKKICQNLFTFMSLSSVFDRVLFPDIQIFMFFQMKLKFIFLCLGFFVS